MSEFRCGSVAVLGKPNVGKSTLVNRLVGQRVSIVSDKRQTTRTKILGIHTTEDFQMVLVDTPGVHTAHTELGKRMNEAARGAMADVDVVLFVADVHKPPQDGDKEVAELIKRNWRYPWSEEHPGFNGVILCLNKMDMLKAEYVQENVDAYCKLLDTEEYMLTCITKDRNVDKLVNLIVPRLPVGEMLFPEDEFTDQPMRTLAAEFVRERALRLTRQEIPHALTTFVELWDEEPAGKLRIVIDIVVEKSGQKAIVIGKGGAMLKQIGTEARQEIERLIERPVYLELVVKVREDWRQNPRMLRDLGLG
jgi:GTPase